MEIDHAALIEQIVGYLSYPPILIPTIILALLAIAGQWLLYEK